MNSKSIRSLLVVALTLMLVSLIGLPKTFAQSGDDVIQIEFVGEIEALTTTTITINGQVIDISTAELNTALAVGEVVKVEGTLESDGSITARELYAVEDDDLLPGEVEIIGPITALDGDTITIGGLVIHVAEAELSDDLVLEVDAVVKVHMSLVADTAGVESWVAREVKADDTSDDSQDDGSDDSNDDSALPGEFEIVGTLTQTDGDTIVVSGLTIDITTAEIKGTLVVGALVKVHLSSVDGVLVAREVELHDTQSSDDDSEDDGSDDNSNNNSNANSNSNNSNDDDDSNANNSNDDDGSNANDDDSNSNDDDDSNANNSNDDDGSNSNDDDSNANNSNDDDGSNSNDDDSNNNDDDDDSSGSNNNDDDSNDDNDSGDDD